MFTKKRPLIERFSEKYTVNEQTGCWEWSASLNHKGYGWFRLGDRMAYAHRVSYEMHVGPIPDGLMIRHKCDNRRCCRPDHLEPGSQIENTKDMLDRKRQAIGARVNRTKLTEDAVREARRLRTDGWSLSKLAARYGVTTPTIHFAVSGRTWRHVS